MEESYPKYLSCLLWYYGATMFLGNIIILVTALAGLYVSNRIRKEKKTQNESFVCPLNFDCHSVVQSDYSKFLGIPLEYLGLLYYGAIALSYGTFLILPDLQIDLISYGVIVASAVAFLVSICLTCIQAFKLKTWCSWCLMSAGFCTVIFLVTLLGVLGILA